MNYIEIIVVFVGIVTSSLSIFSVISYQIHKKDDLSEYATTYNNKLVSIDCSLHEYSKKNDTIYDNDYYKIVLTESEIIIINSLKKKNIVSDT